MYAEGNGVPRDDVEAMRWYHHAAEAGSPVAMLNLGTNYCGGRGVPGAYLGLAQMAENGLGMPRDDAEALRWYRQAAARDIAFAKLNIGIYYEVGRGRRVRLVIGR